MDKKQIIELYREKSLEKGRPLSVIEINKDNELPSVTLVYSHFNSISELRKAAGIKLTTVCYDERNDRYILNQGNKEIDIDNETFCENCVENPETCGKNVENCKKEVIDFE